MLPVKYRLKKRKTFNYIYKHGKASGGDFVTVIYCNGRGKFGFSASKKVGNSVVRHRAVRLMREAVRPFIDKVNPKSDYIFVAKEGITGQHLLYITLEVEKVLRKCGML